MNTNTLTTERAIRILAGSMILLSLALYQLVSPWGLLLAAFVGLNLLQSSFTGFCPAEEVLARLGIGTPSCGVDSAPKAASAALDQRTETP